MTVVAIIISLKHPALLACLPWRLVLECLLRIQQQMVAVSLGCAPPNFCCVLVTSFMLCLIFLLKSLLLLCAHLQVDAAFCYCSCSGTVLSEAGKENWRWKTRPFHYAFIVHRISLSFLLVNPCCKEFILLNMISHRNCYFVVKRKTLGMLIQDFASLFLVHWVNFFYLAQRHLTSYPYRCTLADFQIEKKIGRGQFSEVYKATCLLDRKPVALKKVQVSILSSKSYYLASRMGMF